MTAGPIDFAALAAALLSRADSLVPQWLPDGKREGHEWKARNPVRDDRAIGSFSVNLVTGAWADFADLDAKGGDLTSLYAYLQGLGNGEAARQLMDQMGIRGADVQTPRAGQAQERRPARADPPTDQAPPAKRSSTWRAIVPVPPTAPPADFRHFSRGEHDAAWEYRYEGQLYGYVVRFRTSDGGKEIIPRTWCVDDGDSRGLQKWHWLQWDVPRPLYVPATLLAGDPALVPVVLVEGEKCALAGHQLLGHEFDFVTWPGGSKAWAKADWSWLRGRVVFMWPDCDAQRERLSKEEREAGLSASDKPLLPAARQPGLAAMVAIGSLLAADLGCQVLLCPVPAPGDVSPGWDIADAIADGWNAETVRAFIRGARVFVPPDDAARAKIGAPGRGSTLPSAGAVEDPDHAWRQHLLKSATTSAIRPVRENIILALDGLPEEGVIGLVEAAGLVGFNEFTNEVQKLRGTPWETPAGAWEENDELELGNWLVRQHWLPSMSRATLEEAVSTVAKRHRFHPVRQELDKLRGTWDGEDRLKSWISRCCLELDATDVDPDLEQYLARVGTWVLMAICARVMTPGCKFDSMLILEGPQGYRKSTLARLMGGDYFADTGLVLGDKDSYQNLQGVLVYEWGELDALTRSEVTKVKQFISSQKDRFRASFDRRPKDYPRQVVFIGTTNEDRYLVDTTGNRRMWPVRVNRPIDTEWFAKHRPQLFAEALHRFEAGERFYPTQGEQRRLFAPQQSQRQVETSIQAEVLRYLYDEDQRAPHGEAGTGLKEVTAQQLLAHLGISVDKRTPQLVKQVQSTLRQAGWQLFRMTRGDRPWAYRRPSGQAGMEPSGSDLPAPLAAPPSPPGQSPGHPSSEAADDAPPF